MHIRSFELLDFELAWRRVLTWAQGGLIDVPDRLPYEVINRVHKARPPRLEQQHHLSPIEVIFSSKKSGTSRPFVRNSPRDVLLYQALLDRLAPGIEKSLPSRDVVFAYRQTINPDKNAFAGTPSRGAYLERLQAILNHPFEAVYSVTADIAGYFFHIDIDELERRLLTISAEVDAVRDVADLLRGWQSLGVRGLPQGLRPSSPLGNIFLLPLDRMLLDHGLTHVRWMDDFVIAASSFHEARSIQDEVERVLYQLGLTLASDKTRILRWDVAIEESEDAKDELARLKESRRRGAEDLAAEALQWMDYPPDEPEPIDPDQLDLETTIDRYDKLLASLNDVDLPKRFQPRASAALRELKALKHPHALDQIPHLLTRAPDLTRDALNYVAGVSLIEPEVATKVFAVLLGSDRFLRDFEKLELCQAVLALPEGTNEKLAKPLGQWALKAEHRLVRARALLAWGAQSAEHDFSVADKFWRTAKPQWQPYVLVAVQRKNIKERDKRYKSWSSSGRFLDRLSTLLRSQPIAWRKL
jgi:Reverse transcriptase (RNA-dependent DNA polymerase)